MKERISADGIFRIFVMTISVIMFAVSVFDLWIGADTSDIFFIIFSAAYIILSASLFIMAFQRKK